VRVALLGTGKMGAAIARRLAAAGHDLVLWNRTPERAREVGAGRVAGSVEEAVAGAEIVLSIVYDASAVLGVLGRVRPAGQLFVQMSTAGPDVEEQLAERLEAAGSRLLTAPILGSVPAIEQGSALILVGGDPEAFEAARAVLEAFGQPEYVGSRRAAAELKLLNNAMLGVVNLAAAELLAAGEREGLEAGTVFRLLTRMVPYLQARSRSLLERDHSGPMFDLDAIVKDLDLALDAGHAAGAAMPVAAQARELYGLASDQHGREEMTAVIELFSR
jgi:3-hydroxyisobutyrate dehydrogenase-like beta-hydroxyacid dehydrogenase